MLMYALLLVVLPLSLAVQDCTDKCSQPLQSACSGTCPFLLLSRTSAEDGSTTATEVLCSDSCMGAWKGADYETCRAGLQASSTDATLTTQAINAMIDACDTICFLQSGTSLGVFQQQCEAIFSGEPCSDACKTLVNVDIDKDCRNNLVTANNPEISVAAKTVFTACQAPFDGPADCSDSCTQAAGVQAACGGQCPFQLLAESNTADNNFTSVGALCADSCKNAWSQDSYKSCLATAGETNLLASLNTAGNQTCPASCFLESYAKDPAGAVDCNAIATNSTQECTSKCKGLVESMGAECRSTVALLPAMSITEAAKVVFDKCGVSYGSSLSATSKLAGQGIIVTAVIAVVLFGILFRQMF